MPELLVLFLAACGTALATGVGAVPVFLLGSRARGVEPLLMGLAAGVMTVAAVLGLLAPAFEEGSALEVLAGSAIGVGFLARVAGRFDSGTTFMGRSGPGVRTSALVFLVLFVHSLPEGFAIGTAFASDRAGLSLFVILAIAIQNVPEGTSVAIPMREAGFGAGRQFWAAVATSAPQPLGAVVAFLAVEAPRSRPSTRSATSALAVSTITGRPGFFSRIARSTSMPSRPGSMRSSTTRSAAPLSARRTPAIPS